MKLIKLFVSKFILIVCKVIFDNNKLNDIKRIEYYVKNRIKMILKMKDLINY